MAAAERDTTPLIDLAAVAVSPVLVMGMVGSLTLFLVEVLHRGQYSGRLVYTLFFYVIGAVLIARISINQGRGRARGYAVGLGIASFIAMLRFVDYPTPLLQVVGPLINVGLMVMIWLSAEKLTWDCTHFDPARTASGRGVLAAAGLDATRSTDADGADDEPEVRPELGWYERYQAYQAARARRPHTPGVWVVYFALAALPLFALGQALIPGDDAPRRRATLLYMAVYIGSALGLLVTTSLMGLRRYLEERGARVPAVLTLGWLGLGGGLIVAFLAVGMVLPRPHSETPLIDLGKGKGDLKASKYAQVKDSNAGKGEGAKGSKQEAGKSGPAKQKSGGQPKDGKVGDKSGGKSDGKKGQDGQKGEKSKGEQSKSGQDEQTKKGPEEKSDPDRKDDTKSQDEKGRDGDKQADEPEKQDGSKDADAKQLDEDMEAASPKKWIASVQQATSEFLRYVTWVIVAAVVIAGLILFVLKGLAPFTNWARDLLAWLRGLFGRKRAPKQGSRGDDAPAAPAVKRPPPFSAYSNPFADGSAADRDPADLAGYTFAAFDAWAWDRGLGRNPAETPTEFAVRVGHRFEELDEPGFAAAEVMVRVMYGRGGLTRSGAAKLAALWDALDAARPA